MGVTFSVNWVKDNRFNNQRKTERLIVDALGEYPLLAFAYNADNLTVNAGPHRKAGAGGGGDARWHMTVRRRNDDAWHIILNDTCNRVIGLETRPRMTGGFE